MRKVLTPISGLLAFFAMAAIAPVAWAGTPAAPMWGDPHTGSYLGVHIDSLTPDAAAALKLKDTSGVVITDLDQDGPACRAGLRENDVIVGFNGSKVTNPAELASFIHATPAGATVAMSVMRDGQKKDVQVKLGSVGQIVARATAVPAGPPVHSMPYPGMMAPDMDIPSFNALSARHGMIVETLSPQLCEYFGVPKGRGVLLRSVERGSSAEAAGLKAGDVIVKVNGEEVHDIADWRRSLHGRSGKTSISFVRDKREQTVEMTLPAPAGNSKLGEFDWDGLGQEEFQKDMQAFQQEMQKLGPELARNQKEIMAAMRPTEKDLVRMQRDLEKSMKLSQKDMKRMTRDMQKSIPSEKQLAEMRSNIEKSLPSQKQIEEMRSQIVNSIPTQQQIDEMRAQIQNSLPTPQQMQEMRRQVEDSIKSWTPQMQQQMEELKKQMEQFKLEMPPQNSPREF